MEKKRLGLMFYLFIELFVYIFMTTYTSLINKEILLIVHSFLSLLISLFLYCKTKDYYLMLISSFISLVADIFFFKNMIISLIFLNINQAIYFLRNNENKKANLVSRLVIIPLIIASYLLLNNFDVFIFLWIILITNLFINILFTIKEIGLNNLFPLSLLSLFISVFFILFFNLNNYLNGALDIVDYLNDLSLDLRMMFYLPFEIMLTCSIFTVNRKHYNS